MSIKHGLPQELVQQLEEQGFHLATFFGDFGEGFNGPTKTYNIQGDCRYEKLEKAYEP